MKKVGLLILAVSSLAACAPEVGSKRWCEDIKGRSAGDISANEAADYARHCLFPSEED